MTYILGISSFYHDSAAVLIKNGKIIGAVQEERFTRKRHDSAFPENSIKYLLDTEKITILDLKNIVFYDKPFLKFERLLETYVSSIPFGFKSFKIALPIWLREKLFLKNLIKNIIKTICPSYKGNNILFAEHHLSHAASAFYPSPYKKAIILTLDGVGEWTTSSIAIGNGNNIKICKEIHFPHSVGLLYSSFTYYLGFKVNSGEYKVMGLAPYGKPIYKDKIIKEIIDLKDDGSFRMNLKYFDYISGLRMTNKKFDNLFGVPRRIPETEDLTQFHMDMAASIQSVTEEIVIRICKAIKNEYKIDNLCLAGGVALNCVANGKIVKEKIFKNIWVQPAAGDAGGALGCALLAWYKEQKNERIIDSEDSMKGSFLGPEYDSDYIEEILKKNKANYKKLKTNEILMETAIHISNGKAIGWFQGRMEFGPRSLGNRSIIADPRSATMQKNLNLKVKFRESFRPFAPAIIYESLAKWFDIDCKSPYMLLVADVKKKFHKKIKAEDKSLFGIDKLNLTRSSIPAVTHVDFSSRIQTVHVTTNKKFYNLLEHFYKLTNVPILVNTSFNVRGEPIVCSPEEALKCFMGTGLDVLVLENFILLKDQQRKEELVDYKDQYELD